jgi:exonuclease-1
MKVAKARLIETATKQEPTQYTDKALKMKFPETVLSRENSSDEQNLPLELEDSAWAAMESKIVIPGSETGDIEDIAAPEPVPATEAKHLKGSEDLLVPDSEGDESDGSEKVKKVLDLGRFAFSQK